jgi:hypothetical protein
MAWLKGSTDVAHFDEDMYNLLTGAIAAGQRGSGQSGNGAQVAGDDAWTGLDATTRVIRSKKTEKPWTLPIACWRGMPRFGLRENPGALDVQIGKPTFSGAYNGATARVYYLVYVSTANSSPGDLTGLVVTYTIINADTGATVTGATTVSGWSGASDTKLLANQVSLTLTLQAGETITASKINWVRGYSTTYPQGVDYRPECAKIDSAQAIVISDTEDGENDYTLNTDYKLVQQADAYPLASVLSTNYCGTDWGGTGVFSGIEWQDAASPPDAGDTYYIVDCNTFAGYLHLHYTGVFVYLITWEFWDGTALKGRFMSSSRLTDVVPAYAYNTPPYAPAAQLFSGTPGAAVYINYWISVKEDKIVLVLRGDPGNGGYLQCITFQRATPLSARETEPWVVVSPASHGRVVHLQTGTFTLDYPYWGMTLFGASSAHPYARNITFQTAGDPASAGDLVYLTGFSSTLPQTLDTVWPLLPILTAHRFGGKDTGGSYTSMNSATGLRSTLRGVWLVPTAGWASLDELVDGGDTYLLLSLQMGLANLNELKYLAVLEE